ncbi:uncharacterized protein [Ptychodera flava]|uniref:uncharacterized protein n=1 Tax=Ptychodera flava TaxID=63121 RepID=UPI00396A0FC5
MHSWKVNAVFLSVVIRLLILSSVRCEFEYYNAYPFYDVSCIGGELENNTLSFDGATSYVNLVRHIPDLTQFTACWWMRSNAGTNTGTIVSYRLQPDSSIQIENPSNLKLTVNGNAGVESGLETNYGLWHHVCVTWDSSDEGKYEIYKAGERLFRKTGLATGGTITGNGELFLGKPNDGLTGGVYEGELTQFNMWSTKLDQDSIKALSEDSLNRGCGNVVSWTSMTSSELVSVQVLDSELPPTPEFPRFCREHWENDTVWVFDGAQNHVIWNYTLPELSEFTVCLWIKVTEQKKFKKTVLSYFVPGDTLGSLVISNVKDVSMTLRNEKGKSSKIDLRDGKWHHLCVTWGSKNGQYRYYKDGVVVKKANLAKGLLVRGGGTLVVGQELVPTGGFVEANALNGEMTSFNMWSKALTEVEVQALYEGRCNRTCGDLIWWPYFTEEYPQTVDLKPLNLDADMDVCLPTDPCLPGVFDDKLWVIDNSGDWSLSPMPKAIPELSEFTICFWFVLDDLYANLTNTVFSYYVPGDTEGSIVFSNVNNLTVTINNQISESTGVNLNDDSSHMICLTWNSTNGNFTIYDKKVEIYQGTDLAVGETIKGGGTLVIGQKQSLIAGGFNKEDAFYGKFRNFNFYGNILDEKGIKKASRTCTPDCGDVISWHELEYIDLINIRVVPFTCGGGKKKSTGNEPDTNNISEKGRGNKRGRNGGADGSDIERERPDKKGRDKEKRAKDRPEKKDRDKIGSDRDRPDMDRDRKDRDKKDGGRDRPDKGRDRIDRNRDRPDKDRDRKDRGKKHGGGDRPGKDRYRKDRDRKDRDKDRPDKDRERKDRDRKHGNGDRPDKDRDRKDKDKKNRDKDQPDKDTDKKDRKRKIRTRKDLTRIEKGKIETRKIETETNQIR